MSSDLLFWGFYGCCRFVLLFFFLFLLFVLLCFVSFFVSLFACALLDFFITFCLVLRARLFACSFYCCCCCCCCSCSLFDFVFVLNLLCFRFFLSFSFCSYLRVRKRISSLICLIFQRGPTCFSVVSICKLLRRLQLSYVEHF